MVQKKAYRDEEIGIKFFDFLPSKLEPLVIQFPKNDSNQWYGIIFNDFRSSIICVGWFPIQFKNVFAKKNLDLFVGKDKKWWNVAKMAKKCVSGISKYQWPFWNILEYFGTLEESDFEIFDHLTFKTNKYIPCSYL